MIQERAIEVKKTITNERAKLYEKTVERERATTGGETR